MLELIIVTAIVVGAAAFLAVRLYDLLHAKGCGACSRCAAPKPQQLTIGRTNHPGAGGLPPMGMRLKS